MHQHTNTAQHTFSHRCQSSCAAFTSRALPQSKHTAHLHGPSCRGSSPCAMVLNCTMALNLLCYTAAESMISSLLIGFPNQVRITCSSSDEGKHKPQRNLLEVTKKSSCLNQNMAQSSSLQRHCSMRQMVLLKNQITQPTRKVSNRHMGILRNLSIYFHFISERLYSKKRDDNNKKLEGNNGSQVPSP